MRLPILPIYIDGTECTEADVSLALSSSVAIRVVPVDAYGVEYPAAAVGVVGDPTQPDIAAFFAAVSAATTELLAARSIAMDS